MLLIEVICEDKKVIKLLSNYYRYFQITDVLYLDFALLLLPNFFAVSDTLKTFLQTSYMLHCHILTLNRINYITYFSKQKYFLNASFTSSKKSHYFRSVLSEFFVQNVLFETGKELIKRKTIK